MSGVVPFRRRAADKAPQSETPKQSHAALDAALLNAHATRDTEALAQLYAQAADAAETAEAAAFYLTHAYIYALDAGVDETTALLDRLVELGRENRTLRSG